MEILAEIPLWGWAVLFAVFCLGVAKMGQRNYPTGYGNSHPGDSGAFNLVICLLILGGLVCWVWARNQ